MLKQRKEPWFQATWFSLHLAAAILHLGSAAYHAKKVREKGEAL